MTLVEGVGRGQLAYHAPWEPDMTVSASSQGTIC